MPKTKAKTGEFTVASGFNVPDGKGGEVRYEAGAVVKESDFEPKVWKKLVKLGAVEKAEE